MSCQLCAKDKSSTGWEHTLTSRAALLNNSTRCDGCALLLQVITQSQVRLPANEVINAIGFYRRNENCMYTQCYFYSDTAGLNRLAFQLDFGTRLKSKASRFSPNTVKEWMQYCSTQHPLCQRRIPAALPRRVVDVGNKEAFLYEPRGGEIYPYAALSHCWFFSKPLKMEAKSLPEYRRRLVWNELPTAFREAIDFTRALDIKYLWIDSLCIEQDNRSDWEVESGRMANIYENAQIVIALHQTKARSSSFRKNYANFEVPHPSGSISCQLWSSSLRAFHPDISLLASRGWCFQVIALSQYER